MTDAAAGSTTQERMIPDSVDALLEMLNVQPETSRSCSEPADIPGPSAWSNTPGSIHFAPGNTFFESNDIYTRVSKRWLQIMWQRLMYDTYRGQPPHVFSDPFTEKLAQLPDPSGRFIAEHLNRAKVLLHARQAYELRIEELRADAELDGIIVNRDSELDFWSFIGSTDLSRRAGLALMDNGNLRAVWKGDDSDHLGLHFLGDQTVQYVIFKRRSVSSQISRVAGIDTFEGIKRQIRAFDLMSLVNE